MQRKSHIRNYTKSLYMSGLWFVLLKNDRKIENITFQIASEFFKDKTKLLVVSKKFGNGPEQKLLDQTFLVLIENVLF